MFYLQSYGAKGIFIYSTAGLLHNKCGSVRTYVLWVGLGTLTFCWREISGMESLQLSLGGRGSSHSRMRNITQRLIVRKATQVGR